MADVEERVSRRNLAMLTIDMVSFGVGTTFLGPTTILPALTLLLGGGPLVVGALSAVQQGGWMLPQLFAGRYTAGRPLLKPYILWPLVVSRASLALLPAVVLATGVRAPALALGALLVCLALYNVGDALASVGWFDLFAKAIPLDMRGRFAGASQSMSNLINVGVGAAIVAILARPRPFPGNYVLLLVLAGGFLTISLAAIALMDEPRGVGQAEAQLPWREYWPRLGAILRGDPRFLWLTATRWLGALADAASAFYVLYATGRLGLPQEAIGLFVSAGVVGGLVSGLFLGPLGDRKGSGSVITVIMALRCLCPLLALAAPLAAGSGLWVVTAAFVAVFALMGVANGGFMVGYMNYVLEIAPPGERSLYIGLSNTLGGLLTLAPLGAGWLVQAASFEALFAATLTVGIAGLLVGLRRPERVAQAVETV